MWWFKRNLEDFFNTFIALFVLFGAWLLVAIYFCFLERSSQSAKFQMLLSVFSFPGNQNHNLGVATVWAKLWCLSHMRVSKWWPNYDVLVNYCLNGTKSILWYKKILKKMSGLQVCWLVLEGFQVLFCWSDCETGMQTAKHIILL